MTVLPLNCLLTSLFRIVIRLDSVFKPEYFTCLYEGQTSRFQVQYLNHTARLSLERLKVNVILFYQGLEDGLPDGMMEMFDMEFDFPPRTHCLSRWWVKKGLKLYCLYRAWKINLNSSLPTDFQVSKFACPGQVLLLLLN